MSKFYVIRVKCFLSWLYDTPFYFGGFIDNKPFFVHNPLLCFHFSDLDSVSTFVSNYRHLFKHFSIEEVLA